MGDAVIREYDEMLEMSAEDEFGVSKDSERQESAFSMAKLRDFFAPDWWFDVAPHAFCNIWVSMITWWIMNAVLPFAAKNTDPRPGGMGEDVLQWAQTLG